MCIGICILCSYHYIEHIVNLGKSNIPSRAYKNNNSHFRYIKFVVGKFIQWIVKIEERWVYRMSLSSKFVEMCVSLVASFFLLLFSWRDGESLSHNFNQSKYLLIWMRTRSTSDNDYWSDTHPFCCCKFIWKWEATHLHRHHHHCRCRRYCYHQWYNGSNTKFTPNFAKSYCLFNRRQNCVDQIIKSFR